MVSRQMGLRAQESERKKRSEEEDTFTRRHNSTFMKPLVFI